MTAPEVSFATKAPAFWPSQPESLADLDISPTLVQDLFLRDCAGAGPVQPGLAPGAPETAPYVLEPVFRQLRQQAYLDVKGIQDNDYHFGLTTAGKTAGRRTGRYLCVCRPGAGISCRIRSRHAAAGGARRVSRESLRHALGDLVLPKACWTNSAPR